MSVRTTLSVLFAVILVAAVSPAVQDARLVGESAEASMALDELVAAGEAHVTRGNPVDGAPGARRTVVVDLPDGYGIDLEDGDRTVALVREGVVVERAALPVRVVGTDADPVVSGRVRVTVRYESRDSGPVLVVARGFISEDAAKQGYVSAPGDAPARRGPNRDRR